MNIKYITIVYMQTPGRWCYSVYFDNEEELHSTIRTDPWELFIKKHYPNIHIKLFDWKTKSWTDGTYDLA